MSNPVLSGVSRETLEKLKIFEAELIKWNKAINLVSPDSLKQGFTRHIIDSAQLVELAPDHIGTWVDLGSGGGLPGIIVSLIAAERQQIDRFVLVESDARKSAFLREISRKLDIRNEILTDRIENIPPLGADVISARALAHLSKLCDLGLRHMKQGACGLFLKGASYLSEIAEAETDWSFEISSFPSKTDVSAAILELKNIKRRGKTG